MAPSVLFYVNQQKPDCLLIATVDSNKSSNETYYTAANYPAADLKSITIEEITQTRILEIIFCLKDLLSNENNYNWLHPTKKLIIIDFSIDEMIKDNPKLAACHAIEPLVDLFVETIDPTGKSINDFICANPYAFNGSIQIAASKLAKIVERTRVRWSELLKFLNIKK
jgi:hypothetical protein